MKRIFGFVLLAFLFLFLYLGLTFIFIITDCSWKVVVFAPLITFGLAAFILFITGISVRLIFSDSFNQKK